MYWDEESRIRNRLNLLDSSLRPAPDGAGLRSE